MMQVIFDHISGYGKVTKEDFIFSDPKGIAMNNTYLAYLSQGWIEWQNYWYNLRSVRIDLKEYQPTKTVKKLSKQVTHQWVFVSDEILEALKPIYQEYVNKHKFKRTINLEDFLGFECLLYYHEGKLIAATIFKTYRDSTGRAFVSYQFLWDYKEPKLSLGNVAQRFECQTASILKCDHVYLLGGYESASIYKSNFQGFEWWTGKEWSKDKDLYLTLCNRDDNI
jgi:hypothetical protein